ncbi:MAG: alanine racemase [Deltaproteobacteria bacterium]|nr:alanine racemase [Deltaproteobacteria bacterium]
MARPTVAEIRLPALRHNFKALRSLLPAGTGVLAVVKANAYGHGAVPVALALEAEGARMLGVATVEEGVELRQGGVRLPVVVLGGADPPQAEEAFAHRLSAVVFDRRQLRVLSRVASKGGRAFPVHVKVDTGMGRLGVLPARALELLAELPSVGGVALEGWMTHLSSADGPSADDREFTERQLSSFAGGIPAVRAGFGADVTVHALNSAGILRFAGTPFDSVRPGITLYGYSPLPPGETSIPLRPVMRVVTRIVSLKELPDGHPVSYNRRYRCGGVRRIAVVPIGYADGYRRGLTGHGRMSVSGRPAPVAGTVCMDHTMLDVTGIPGAEIGAEVEVMGEASMTAEEIARVCGTIPYEVLTQVGARIPRRTVD